MQMKVQRIYNKATFESTERPRNEDLDIMMGTPYAVGSDGFVRLVDYCGNEDSIVRAARVSYGKGTKSVSEDTALIRYLIEHGHTSPLEQASITVHMRLPIYVARQLIRHRTAKLNEYSGRYSEMIDSCDTVDIWRGQGTTNKQGSEGGIDWPEGFNVPEFIDGTPATPDDYLSAKQAGLHKEARDVYEERLAFGVAREQARVDLPLSNYTEWYWQMDMNNLLRTLSLRQDSHAQQEIREYGDALAIYVERGFPNVWQAHLDFDTRKNALALSAPEIKAFHIMEDGGLGTFTHEAIMKSDVLKGVLPSKRAQEAFLEKYETITRRHP